MKNILLIITSHSIIPGTDKKTGFSLYELAKSYFIFHNSHFSVEVASLTGGKCTPESDSMVRDDSDVQQFLNDENLRNLFEHSRCLLDFNPDSIGGIFFVGGLGCLWDFPYDVNLRSFCSQVYGNGGVVAAVGHGVIALTNIVESSGQSAIYGKSITGLSNEEENRNLMKAEPLEKQDLTKYYPVHPTGKQTLEDILTASGCSYTTGGKNQPYVVKDDRIITGQNYLSSAFVATEMVQIIQQISSAK